LNNLDVYFDFVDVGDDIEIGIIIEDDGEVVDSYLESFEGIKHRGNNYHFSLLGWKLAVRQLIKYLKAEGDIYDGIVFCNQNKLIFDWAERGKCPLDYEKGISQLYTEVKNLLEIGKFEMKFKTVKGKENKAKKILKKRKDKKSSITEYKMSFGNLVSQVEPVSKKMELKESEMKKDNVVNMFDKKVNEA
jgi:hypothetical protein